jgi:hypothetical protein
MVPAVSDLESEFRPSFAADLAATPSLGFGCPKAGGDVWMAGKQLFLQGLLVQVRKRAPQISDDDQMSGRGIRSPKQKVQSLLGEL